jgi:hypothetical protein
MEDRMSDYGQSYDRSKESGQAIVLIVLGLGIFLLGTTALAVDFTNLWFHREAAQGAADAACAAGVQEMLTNVNNPAFTPNFTVGTAFNCTTASDEVPCWYARQNGYDSDGGTPGDSVSFSFPTGTCPGPALDPNDPIHQPTGGNCPAPGVTPAGLTNPFLRVDIIERVQVSLVGLFNGTRTQDVRTFAVCGIVETQSTVPLAVLAPLMDGSFTINNNSNLVIAGGAKRSVGINSSSSTAVSAGASANINIAHGSSDYCGGILSIFGGPTAPTGGFTSPTWPAGLGTEPSCGSTHQQWVAPGAAVPDPFAFISPPTTSGLVLNPAPITVAPGVDGCPETVGNNCREYSPGQYTSGITISPGGAWAQETALFQPGIYYITGGDFHLKGGSCLRPTMLAGSCTYCLSNTTGWAGDGNGGAMFYFADGHTINVDATAGQCNFRAAPGISSFPTVAEKCTGTSVLPGFVPSSITDSVLLAPCTGSYGDPLGASDPLGVQRGMLFFQNRSFRGQISFGGQGQLLMAGSTYSHRCTTSGSDVGTGCVAPTSAQCSGGTANNSSYCSSISFSGGSGSTTLVLGNIVTDVLSLGGNTTLAMTLNPGAAYVTYKASLFR